MALWGWITTCVLTSLAAFMIGFTVATAMATMYWQKWLADEIKHWEEEGFE